MKNLRVATAAVACVLLTTAGCTSGSQTEGSKGKSGAAVTFEKKSDPVKFGYSIYDLQDPYFQSYLAGVKAEADKNGIKVISTDSKGSQETQVNGSKDLINQGISALIISPVEPAALPSTVVAAHQAKIPVVVGDVGATGDYDAFITSDNVNGGKQAADFIVKQVAKKPKPHQVAIVGLPSGNDTGTARVKAFKETMGSTAGYKITSDLSGLSIQDSFKAAQDAITANPGLQAIYCASSNNVVGASRAIQQAGKGKDIVLVGFNGDPVELDMIAKGSESATIAQQPYKQGQLAVQTSLDLLDGKKASFTDSGTRTISVPVKLIDKANLQAWRDELASQK